jgi:hypothetical protein
MYILLILVLLSGCCGDKGDTAEKIIIPKSSVSVTFMNDSTVTYHSRNGSWDISAHNNYICIANCVETGNKNLYIPSHNIKYFILHKY